jgi:DNA ligase D-like protein (predicted ligase)
MTSKQQELTPLEWQEPMLATLTYNYFSDPAWIYECKMDGERCLAYSDGEGAITLYSRNKQILNSTYPELAQALASSSSKSFVIDGEIIAFNKQGISSFSQLQQRIGLHKPTTQDVARTSVYYYVFDLIYLEGRDLQMMPLIERKAYLKQNIIFNQKIVYTKHYWKYGLKYYSIACKKKWEGIIAKNAYSNYQHHRSKDWLKFKCGNEQEFIIVGYTDPQGSRIGFGALLLGLYENGVLKYAGKVGTGFDYNLLRTIQKRLLTIKSTVPTLTSESVKEKNIHWVEAKLVCQIAFTEWTNDNKLRHPRFLGLRLDKDPSEVIREKVV